MKQLNFEKMQCFLNNRSVSPAIVEEMKLSYDDYQDMIEYIGQRLSLLKAMRGPIIADKIMHKERRKLA